jgi:uncharacterized damage-inducible protein DinB
VTSARADIVELSHYAWGRLWDRMVGLSDDEYSWEPAAGFTTLAWRLGHITDLLQEDRNGPWLGRPTPEVNRSGAPVSAAEALAALEAAYGTWRTVLEGTTDESLASPIGRVGGPYGTSTRRSFALHVLDELIHHGAEVALLRDLYQAKEVR